jgi:hypothetical protein
MSDEHALTSRQADQLQTDIPNVESGLEVIMEQVARLPTRKRAPPTSWMTGGVMVFTIPNQNSGKEMPP